MSSAPTGYLKADHGEVISKYLKTGHKHERN